MLLMGHGSTLQIRPPVARRQPSREFFFNLSYGDQLRAAAWLAKRQSDERIGDTPCCALTTSLNSSAATTLWIGRDDLLIHQLRSTTSAAMMKATFQTMAEKNPNLPLPAPQDAAFLELHSNIAVDTLSPMDIERYTLKFQNSLCLLRLLALPRNREQLQGI